jgi:hypothetical protein
MKLVFLRDFRELPIHQMRIETFKGSCPGGGFHDVSLVFSFQ